MAKMAGFDAEWAELPHDGAQAWLGAMLIVASAAVTMRALLWLGATIAGQGMQ